MSVLASLWLALSPLARAHDYPIKPVHVVLRVEPGRVVADITSDSIYWVEEVSGNESSSPTQWKPQDLQLAEKYVNEHLRLTADGKPLAGRLVRAEYVQRPWQVYEQGLVKLRMTYPSAWDAAKLTGQADFFEDFRKERIEYHQPILPTMDFRTLLKIPGRRRARFELKPGATDFSIPVADARRTAPQRIFQSFKIGADSVFSLMEGWAAIAGLALSLGTRSSLAFAALLAGLAWPAANPGIPAWIAGLVASVCAGRWAGESWAPWLEAIALAAAGAAWSGASLFWLPGASPGALERSAAALGSALGAALALIAGLLAVTLERKRAQDDSASAAETLFARRRRLAATALVIVTACGLWQELSRHA